MNKPNESYWIDKLEAYLHDPFDKVFHIQGHEKRAARLKKVYGIQECTNDEQWKKADGMASGIQRGQVPSHSEEETRKGSVDFYKNPVLTHAISGAAPIRAILPEGSSASETFADDLNRKIEEYLKEKIGMKPGDGGLSNEKIYENNPQAFSFARFLYTHLVLRGKLSEDNVGDLGALWHRLPADSRFPDHTIWQHAGMVSAINSCLNLSKDKKIGLMVFSITPVQAFIAKARKLRDFWTGSVLLSWLGFEGIRWVMENLGPDHVVYPSLIDQPLVNRYLQSKWKISTPDYLKAKDTDKIASLPNKFLFLIPLDKAEEIGGQVSKAINSAWKELTEKVCNEIIKVLGNNDNPEIENHIAGLFARQNSAFWDIQWAATGMVEKDDRVSIERLLRKSVYEYPYEVMERFNKIIKDKGHWDKSGIGALYQVSHGLVQSSLASTKTYRVIKREKEPGQKCHLCGEFEAIHYPYKKDDSASVYKKCIADFWDAFIGRWHNRTDFRENERLCTICMIKRIAYYVLGKDPGHILHHTFEKSKFPSTTGMAISDLWDKIPQDKRKGLEKEDMAQCIHQMDTEMPHTEAGLEDADKERAIREILRDFKVKDRDKYYAILVMDGDKMGELVSGERISSKWGTAMHPEIVERMKSPGFDERYRVPWGCLFENKRLLTPDIHAAISEALGDFAIHGVSRIIREHKGELIYAGGDDVCAVLPVGSAINAARQIREYYRSEFKYIPSDKDSASEDISNVFTPGPGKLSIHMGKGCTISAGILVCHHKEPLSMMIARAQHLLEEYAKEKSGRDACAIELRKRAGGSRFFMAKWDEPNPFFSANTNKTLWDSFLEVGGRVFSGDATLSRSLIYKFSQFEDGFNAIKEQPQEKMVSNATALVKLQVRRSVKIKGSDEEKDRRLEEVSRMISGLMLLKSEHEKTWVFNPESLVVADFICAKGGDA
ncbi:MAG: type III-B CRISPR-associated protein Cas10/Cmr2 [Deltaproteobacteria bacterium]|nr:type III-B CRISPR-associated protein Cas10/Cmr2 [Deltaproteobacteria bacterium]